MIFMRSISMRFCYHALIVLIYILYCCFPGAAQTVRNEDIQRYLQGFARRPKPLPQPKVHYQALVSVQPDRATAWLIGRWQTPDGFVAIYPAQVPGRVCVLTHTAKSSAYAEGRIQGAVLRTDTPLFTSHNEQFLRYAAADVFVPVFYRGNAYLGWGLYDFNQRRARFLTLTFHDRPPDPVTFLRTGRTATAIQAQFRAAGCITQSSKSPETVAQALRNSSVVEQTINGITTQIKPLRTRNNSRTFQVQIRNNTRRAFGFMPNQVAVYGSNYRRLRSQFSTFLHGTVIPRQIQIVEATPDRRRFTFKVNP
jgi:hypothetical protein